MRLLKSDKAKEFGFNGVLRTFFVKPQRVFISANKISYDSKSGGRFQIIMDYKDDKWHMLDFLWNVTLSGHEQNKLFASINEFLNKLMAEEDVKKKCESFTDKYFAPVVRPIQLCSYSMYTAHSQGFGIAGAQRSVTWFSCREEFAKKFSDDLLRMFFCVLEANSKDYNGARQRSRRVARFIRKIEDILKLEEKTTFYETSDRNIIEVMPTVFWREHTMKRSLLTVLLRSGLLYDFKTDNWQQALKGYDYSNRTYDAISVFLDGRTKFVGTDKVGWVNTFNHMSTKDSKKALVKP